jgi:hypothetical protein
MADHETDNSFSFTKNALLPAIASGGNAFHFGHTWSIDVLVYRAPSEHIANPSRAIGALLFGFQFSHVQHSFSFGRGAVISTTILVPVFKL